MPFNTKSTSGVPTSTLPVVIAALKVDPTYVAHLAVDESPTRTYLVVVHKDATGGSRGAAPGKASTSKPKSSRKTRGKNR